MEEVYYASVASPIGTIWVASDKSGVCLVSFGGTVQEFRKELSTAGFRHAQAIGNPRACRAVGGANSRNPLPLLIPCHRVIRKDGALGGFSSGTAIKQWLLNFEQQV